MNEGQKQLAARILHQVESQPESFDMSSWQEWDNDDRFDWRTGEPVPGCGTTRDVAGWAVYFSARPGEDIYAARLRIASELGTTRHYADLGQSLLGLTDEQAEFFYANEEEAVAFLRELVAE